MVLVIGSWCVTFVLLIYCIIRFITFSCFVEKLRENGRVILVGKLKNFLRAFFF